MGTLTSSPDFPFTLASRESEMVWASNVAAANEHVRHFFEALLGEDDVYWLTINGQNVSLERSQGDADLAYRLFLASPEANRESRRLQATAFLQNGKLYRREIIIWKR